MLFWLKKALTIPFMPLYFTLLAGLTGLVFLFFTKRLKLARAVLALAVVSLAVFSNKGVARLLIAPLETQYSALPEGPLAPSAGACRYIMVLGGGHADAPQLSRVNQLSTSALGRLTEGVRLAYLLPKAQLIVSGYNGPRTLSHAQILSEAAQSLGISASRILRFDDTRDTDDEAQALRRTVGTEPFLLVTSAWHMPRAMALCQKAGLHPIAAPADFMLKPDNNVRADWFSWDLSALERSTKAVHERLGLLWAKLLGKT